MGCWVARVRECVRVCVCPCPDRLLRDHPEQRREYDGRQHPEEEEPRHPHRCGVGGVAVHPVAAAAEEVAGEGLDEGQRGDVVDPVPSLRSGSAAFSVCVPPCRAPLVVAAGATVLNTWLTR